MILPNLSKRHLTQLLIKMKGVIAVILAADVSSYLFWIYFVIVLTFSDWVSSGRMPATSIQYKMNRSWLI